MMQSLHQDHHDDFDYYASDHFSYHSNHHSYEQVVFDVVDSDGSIGWLWLRWKKNQGSSHNSCSILEYRYCLNSFNSFNSNIIQCDLTLMMLYTQIYRYMGIWVLYILQHRSYPQNMNKVSPQPFSDHSELEISGSCRICLQEDSKLIKPCECTGTIEYVHEECMRQWILSKIRLSSRKESQYCEICKSKIHFLYKSMRQLDCKSANCQKIGCCYLVGLFLVIIINIILSILLHFNDSFFENQTSKVILIVCIILVSFAIIVTIISMVYISSTVKKYSVTKIYELEEWKSKNERSGRSLRSIRSRTHISRQSVRIEQSSELQSRFVSGRVIGQNV